MSSIKKQNIVCPKCRSNSQINMWESVNVTKNPEMFNKVRDGSLFEFVCPSCGFKSRLVYTTLYHDMENKQMIFLCTTEDQIATAKDTFDDIRTGRLQAEASEKLKSKTGIEFSFNNNASYDDYTFRIVSTYDKLKEKLNIFDSKLDDRVIEIYKAALWAALNYNNVKVDRTAYLYLSKNEDGSHTPRIQFFEEDGSSGAANLDPPQYAYIENMVNSADDAGGYIYDEKWADYMLLNDKFGLSGKK